MSQELATKREVVLVGDFQQLQPIHGVHQLRVDLDREAAARQRLSMAKELAQRATKKELTEGFLQWFEAACTLRRHSRGPATGIFVPTRRAVVL